MPEQALISLVSSPESTLATSKVITDVVRQIVDQPERIAIKTRTDGRTVTLMMSVAHDDIGKVIGRHGRTARSLRVLLSSISGKTGLHYELDIEAEPT